ncbi:hypothetical protein Hanom_Chr17g01574411 [Helianthus anomalus]
MKGEIESFYTTEGTSQLTFPSLLGYRKPRNLDEYLKLKARQADYIGNEMCKGLADRAAQGILSHELARLARLEIMLWT